MSDSQVSSPTPEEMLAELQELRADRAIGAQLLDAARARADQDSAALREVTAERDRWQSAAETMRGELWRQVDELRDESIQQHHQITQLSVALEALLEAIVGTTPTVEPPAAASEMSPDVAAEATGAERMAGPVQTPETPAAQTSVAPAPETPAPPGETPAPEPSPAPATVLTPYVPANEPPRPHLQPKPEPAEPVPHPEHDRVGVFAELMAVAVDSVPQAAAGSAADRETDEDAGQTDPSGMTILPAADPVPTKRRRLPRLG